DRPGAPAARAVPRHGCVLVPLPRLGSEVLALVPGMDDHHVLHHLLLPDTDQDPRRRGLQPRSGARAQWLAAAPAPHLPDDVDLRLVADRALRAAADHAGRAPPRR